MKEDYTQSLALNSIKKFILLLKSDSFPFLIDSLFKNEKVVVRIVDVYLLQAGRVYWFVLPARAQREKSQYGKEYGNRPFVMLFHDRPRQIINRVGVAG